jgi:phenylalanine-4-hydroxylase
LITHVPSSKTIKSKITDSRSDLEALYQSVRNFREGTDTNLSLSNIFHEIKLNHPNDWLLPLEIAEILSQNKDNDLMQEVLIHLEKLKENRPAIENLIKNGLELIFEQATV